MEEERIKFEMEYWEWEITIQGPWYEIDYLYYVMYGDTYPEPYLIFLRFNPRPIPPYQDGIYWYREGAILRPK